MSKRSPLSLSNCTTREATAWNCHRGVCQGGLLHIPQRRSLGAGRYLVIAESPATILSKFGVSALGPWSGSLNNDGDQIQLLNASGGLEDEVDYQLGFPWPTVGDPPGYSIGSSTRRFDNNLGGNGSVHPSRERRTRTRNSPPAPRARGVLFQRSWCEPSSPATAWRAAGFNDSGWAPGTAPIGYDPGIAMGTTLSDMRGYSHRVIPKEVPGERCVGD